MSTFKSCLFGGALMAAGIANAQEFTYSANSVSGNEESYAGSYAPYESYDFASGAELKNTFVSEFDSNYGSNTFQTTQDATSMTATGQWAGDGSSGQGFGFAYIVQFFQVTEDAQILIEWDFSSTDNFVSADLFLDEGDSFSSIFELDNNGDNVGSALVDVEAGVDYGIDFGLIRGFGPFLLDTELKYINVTLIPAPGAVGLLAVAGLAASRRRR